MSMHPDETQNKNSNTFMRYACKGYEPVQYVRHSRGLKVCSVPYAVIQVCLVCALLLCFTVIRMYCGKVPASLYVSGCVYTTGVAVVRQ